jgi:hypothetical protein
MATRIGIVKKVIGDVIAIGANKQARKLIDGDNIFLEDIINTGQNGKVILILDDGRILKLNFNGSLFTNNIMSEASDYFFIKNKELEILQNPNKFYKKEQKRKYYYNEDKIEDEFIDLSNNSQVQNSWTKISSALINKANFILAGHISSITQPTMIFNNLDISAVAANTMKSQSFISSIDFLPIQNNHNIQAPKIKFLNDINGDGFLSKNELNSVSGIYKVTAQIQIPTNSQNGDKIKLEIIGENGEKEVREFTVNGEYILDNKSGQKYQIIDNTTQVNDIIMPTDTKTTVKISLEDLNGRQSQPNITDISAILTPPTALDDVVISKDINKDGKLDSYENKFNTPSTTGLDITIPNNAKDGDKIKITTTSNSNTLSEKIYTIDKVNSKVIDENGKSYKIVNNKFNTQETPVSNNSTTTITTQVIDRAGNEGTQKISSITPDNKICVKFSKDINGDNNINKEEANSDSNPNQTGVDILLPNIANAGDLVRVKISSQGNDSNKIYKISDDKTKVIEIDNSAVPTGTQIPIKDGKFTINNIPISENRNIQVEAKIIDSKTNNTINETVSNPINVILDTTPPSASTITIINDKDANGILNASENGFGKSSDKTDVKITIPSDAKDGDKIVIKSTNPLSGKDIYTTYVVDKINNRVINSADNSQIPITNDSIITKIPLLGSNTKISIQNFDKAGNKTLLTVPIDIQIDNKPQFSFNNDTNSNGLLDKNELNGTSKIGNKFQTDLNISIPNTAKVGDIIRITTSSNNDSQVKLYKISDDGLNVVLVDKNGTPIIGEQSLPIIDGKIKAPNIEIANEIDTKVSVSIISSNGYENNVSSTIQADDTPPSTPSKATLTADKNGDGKIDTIEKGFGDNATHSNIKFSIPNDTKTGDEIKVIISNADGEIGNKTYIIDKENNKAKDENGNNYDLITNEKGETFFIVPNAAPIANGINIKTQVIDKVGNESVIKLNSIILDDSPKATLSADKNKDGVVSSNEVDLQKSTIDIHLPNDTKVGDKIKAKIQKPDGSINIEEYIINPDGKTATNSNNPTQIIPIKNSTITIPEVEIPIINGSKILITTTITDSDGIQKSSNASSPSINISTPTKTASIEFVSDKPKEILTSNGSTANLKPDGIIDSFENGFGKSSDKTNVNIGIPANTKSGDRILVTTIDPNGKEKTQEFTIDKNLNNTRVIAPDGKEIDVDNNKFSILIPIENNKNTTIKTQVVDFVGNKGEEQSATIKFDGGPKVRFIADKDGDGLIDNTSGHPITSSEVEVAIPSSAKVGDSIKIAITNPNTGEINSTEYKISNDGKTVINSNNPTVPIVIKNGIFTIDNIPVSPSKPTKVDVDILRDGNSISHAQSSGRLFQFGVLEYVDDIKFVTQVDGGIKNSSKYLLEKDYEHVISKGSFDDDASKKITYKIALTNDEQPKIVLGINQPDTSSISGADVNDPNNHIGKVLIEIKSEKNSIRNSFYAEIKDGKVVIDLENIKENDPAKIAMNKNDTNNPDGTKIMLDDVYNIIDATYVNKENKELRDESLKIDVDLDSTPDKLNPPMFDGDRKGTENGYAVTFSGSAQKANHDKDISSNNISVVDINTSEKKILSLDDNLKFDGDILTTLTSGSKEFIVKRNDDAGNISIESVAMISNSGFDVDMWFYDWTDKEFTKAYNNGQNAGIYTADFYNKWIQSKAVSATTTFNTTEFTSGRDYKHLSNKGNLHVNDLARVAHSPKASSTDIDGTTWNVNKTGNYTLGEAQPKGSDLILKMDGWLYIAKSGDYKIKASEYENYMKIMIDGATSANPTMVRKIGSKSSSLDNTNPESKEVDIHLEKGFHKLTAEYADGDFAMNFKISIKEKTAADSEYKALGADSSGTHLFSNNYVKALEQNGFIQAADANNFHSLKEKDGKFYGDNASDFSKLIQLMHDDKDITGSNLDDAFVYGGKSIDAKGGADTLIFVDDIDLTKLASIEKIETIAGKNLYTTELDQRMESFEKIQLGTNDRAVSIALDVRSILDITDSRITEGGLKSLNTVLKITGDEDDLVKLVGNFVKATQAEITTLNTKHNVVGDEYNKVEVDDQGQAINQVYKGTANVKNSAGIVENMTVFIEIQKDIQVDI